MNIRELNCITKENESKIFFYYYETEGKETTFRVNDNINILESDFFELTVREIDDNTVRIETIANNNNPSLIAKGIPDALIPEISKIFKKDVISSSNKNVKDMQSSKERAQYRTISAEKYWIRLTEKKFAEYDKDKDVYRYKYSKNG